MIRFGKRILPCVGALLLSLCLAAPAMAGDATAFIKQIGDRAVSSLSRSDITDQERQNRFRVLLNENFDIQRIGRFVVGRYWRTMSPEQQTEYLKLFEDYVVQIYANRFGEYQGAGFTVDQAKPVSETDQVVVGQILQGPGAKPIPVTWRVRESDGKMKVTDIAVEGVSMAVTQRDEFASVIARNSGKVEALIDELKRKTGA